MVAVRLMVMEMMRLVMVIPEVMVSIVQYKNQASHGRSQAHGHGNDEAGHGQRQYYGRHGITMRPVRVIVENLIPHDNFYITEYPGPENVSWIVTKTQICASIKYNVLSLIASIFISHQCLRINFGLMDCLNLGLKYLTKSMVTVVVARV